MPRLPRRLTAVLTAVLLLVLGVAILSPVLTYPFGRDQGVFATVADVIDRGGAPYRDAWDMKPPGIFYLFWFSFKVFGRSEMAPRVLDVVWTLSAAIAIWALGRRLFVSWVGVAAALLFIVHYVATRYYWHSTQCDGFASLPLTLAALALVADEGRARTRGGIPWFGILCGALVGLAIMLKYTLGIFLLLPWCSVLLARGDLRWARVRTALACLAGCTVVLGALIGVIWHAGWLGHMIDVTLLWNAKYAAIDIPGVSSNSLLREFYRSMVVSRNPYLLPAGLLALVGAISVVVHRPDERPRWLPLAWLLVLVASVWVQGRYYAYHWLPVLPPFALLAAHGMQGIAEQLQRGPCARASRALCALGVLLLLGIVGYGCSRFLSWQIRYLSGNLTRETYLRGYDMRIATDFSLLADRDVAAWIAERTPREAAIFIWGFEPLIYFLADRPPASRFIYSIPLLADWSPAEWRSELVHDLRRKAPHYVVVGHDDAQPWMVGRFDDSAAQLETYPELKRLLEDEYQVVKRIQDFDIWERKPDTS